MLIPRRLASLLLAYILTSLSCHAQTPVATKLTTGATLSPTEAYRVEILLRGKVELAPESTISIGPVQPSDIAGFHTINVTFTADDKTSRPVSFLISDDGKTIAQFIKYDISAAPPSIVSAARPSRGGPASAPVEVVNFDDLECPFCARFHESIFPALVQRYGEMIHIVYEDFPLSEIHPWAMHAAVDVNCLAAQSSAGYWNLIDYIHHNANDFGSDPNVKSDPTKSDAPKRTLDRAYTQLDKLTREQGAQQKVDTVKLDSCIAKQDASVIDTSKLVGNSLNIGSTPTFFINGAKYVGAVSLSYIFGQIDDALRARNLTPPPPYVPPAVTVPTPIPPTKPKPSR